MISRKILTRTDAAALFIKCRKEGKVTGFTSGVFDLLHAGHAAYLEEARTNCDFLCVAINTDASVKGNKGEKRPVINENERASLLAALESVDCVFLFEEKNNNTNVSELKPDIYFKAGDYDLSKLTSATIMHQWGGKTMLMKQVAGLSTSALIQKIARSFPEYTAVQAEGAEHYKIADRSARKTVLLDRDGVINKEIEYLHNPDQFELLPGVIEGLTKLKNAGFVFAVITTQAGIGLGYFTEEDFYRVNKKMLSEFSKNNLTLEKVYFCPHSKGDNCGCRKPGTLLLDRAKHDIQIDPQNFWMIGDKTSDILAGERAGARTVLIETGHGGRDKEFEVTPALSAADLTSAASQILKLTPPE